MSPDDIPPTEPEPKARKPFDKSIHWTPVCQSSNVLVALNGRLYAGFETEDEAHDAVTAWEKTWRTPGVSKTFTVQTRRRVKRAS